ncbi:MAG: hypothetical protein NC548_31285 [Lachnospiraceae bacterium]|nr:hypothetical protein [Bacteroides fragilis]MCM1218988.1 hypothetical protein [Lachnospiraceae bacterium]
MEDMKGYLNQIERTLQWVRSDGYKDGYNKAKEEYGQSKGITHCHRATKEEVERHGIELHGWCDCGKPIEGRWVGLANFCPWCGKIMEWVKEDENNSDY